MASSTRRHPPCTLCPCSSSSCQGGASTLGVSPALCPGGCGAAELGCDFSPCGVNTALGLEGGSGLQNPPKGLSLPSVSPQTGWALLWCPCGPWHGAQEGTPHLDQSVAPLSPSPRFLFHPPCSCHRFHFSPLALASFHFPFLLLFPFCLISLQALKISGLWIPTPLQAPGSL